MIALSIAAALLLAQTAPASFDAVSIKPVQGRPRDARPASPDRFLDAGATLHSLIRYAYAASALRVLGGDRWTRESLFAVNAVASRAPGETGMRLLVRRMLEERFGLRLHQERREIPVFVLARIDPDRLGPRMKQSETDCGPLFRNGVPPPDAPRDSSGLALCRIGASGSDRAITMIARGAPLTYLTLSLESRLARPIIDETGLSGTFDFDLTTRTLAATLGAAADTDAPEIVPAVEEQLGLRLRAERRAIDVWVIDDAHPPTAD